MGMSGGLESAPTAVGGYAFRGGKQATLTSLRFTYPRAKWSSRRRQSAHSAVVRESAPTAVGGYAFRKRLRRVLDSRSPEAIRRFLFYGGEN